MPGRWSNRSIQQVVLGLFIVSGAAGLIYQVVWSRELVLLFGNTSQAISTIVTAFLFGLGTGALAGGRVAAGHRNPLRLYGLIELAVAVLAVGLPNLFPYMGTVYANAYTSTSPDELGLIRFGLAFVAVSPATFAMGMTLPALAAFMVRSMEGAGKRLSELYAANTLGAVAGTLVAGFALIELLGLSATGLVAVGLNLSAGTVALVFSRRTNDLPLEARQPAGAVGDLRMTRVVYAATFVSGFAALAFEVLWTRLLAEGSGSRIYLFSAILAIYLFGIAAGSAFYGARSRPEKDTLGALGVCLGAIGIAAWGTVFLGSGPLGNGYFSTRPLILAPATFAMGYAFPLSVRLVTHAASDAGASVGRLYAANTAGSVLGSFAAVFVLASTLGTNTSILWLGALELGVGGSLIALEARVQRRRFSLAAGSMAVLALIAIAVPTSGLPITQTATENRLQQEGVLVAHREDNIATVDVEGGPLAKRRLYVGGVTMTFLTVDIKVMAYLPKALRPDSSDLLNVCFGMGSSYRSSLILGMRTDSVELSPTVPAQMVSFYPDAGQYLNNPRGRIIIGDGRNYVRVTNRRYDAIVVDPPPPIEAAGAVVLYTNDFFNEARTRLKPGGIFLIWIPYVMTLDEFKTHLRTFRSAFRHVKVVLSPLGYGAYFLGSDEPMNFDQASLNSLFGSAPAQADFATAPDDPGLDGAAWADRIQGGDWMNDGAVDAFVGSGPMITDDHPISEYFLIRALTATDHERIDEGRLRALTK